MRMRRRQERPAVSARGREWEDSDWLGEEGEEGGFWLGIGGMGQGRRMRDWLSCDLTLSGIDKVVGAVGGLVNPFPRPKGAVRDNPTRKSVIKAIYSLVRLLAKLLLKNNIKY